MYHVLVFRIHTRARAPSPIDNMAANGSSVGTENISSRVIPADKKFDSGPRCGTHNSLGDLAHPSLLWTRIASLSLSL